MEATSKNKWQVRAAALVIFVLGFAAGALTLNLYRSYSATRETGPPRHRFMERMLGQLDLNADQRAQMEVILKETRAELTEIRNQSQPQVAEVRKRSLARMEQVLTPDQWQQLQRLMKEVKGRRHKQRPPADESR